MLKEALEYIVNLSAPHMTEVDGETYSDKHLERVTYAPKAQVLHLSTLTSLVEYIKTCKKDMYEEYDEKWIIHIESEKSISVCSMLDVDRNREKLIEVTAQLPAVMLNQYVQQENFLIGMKADFVFRMKSDERGIRCALFEADGGAWKYIAMNNIRAYLNEELKDEKNIVILA